MKLPSSTADVGQSDLCNTAQTNLQSWVTHLVAHPQLLGQHEADPHTFSKMRTSTSTNICQRTFMKPLRRYISHVNGILAIFFSKIGLRIQCHMANRTISALNNLFVDSLNIYIYIYIYSERERVVYSRIVLMFFELSNALLIVKHTVQYQYQLFFVVVFCLSEQHAKATFVFAEPSQPKLSAQPLVSTCFRLVLLPVCTYVWCCWWFSV